MIPKFVATFMCCLKAGVVLILTFLSAQAQTSQATASQTPVLSKEAPIDIVKCAQCHTADMVQLPVAASQTQKCKLCHNNENHGVNLHKNTLAGDVGGKLHSGQGFALVDSVQAAPASAALAPSMRPDIAHGDAKKMATGMSFPMYSSPSRLGDKPNEMILITAGEFTMGSNDRLPDEGPMHKVRLPAYYIDKYEVTNLQYKSFIDATNRRSPRYFRNRTFPEGKADHPVTYVNWKDADAYCKWAGKRLPTEQEWEKAARGSDARTYPWGNTFEVHFANTPVRWEKLGVFGDTTPVGSFDRGISPFGVHDMSGNVWEWTASWYKPHPGNQTPSESYGERYKILKGGSWWDCSFYKCGLSAPVYNRSFFAAKVKNDSFGFRCAKDGK